MIKIQGDASSVQGLKDMLEAARLFAFSVSRGVYKGLEAVITLYKPAAQARVVDGVNVNKTSVSMFQECADMLIKIAEKLPDGPFKAWMLHDAASCLARHNGNKPDDQEKFNRAAVEMLLGYNEMEQGNVFEDPDWRVVYAKAAAGLYEMGAHTFVEGPYRKLIAMLEVDGSKDGAGRRMHLAMWLVVMGRLEDAIEALRPVADPAYEGAPNQIREARAYLSQLE